MTGKDRELVNKVRVGAVGAIEAKLSSLPNAWVCMFLFSLLFVNWTALYHLNYNVIN